MIIFGYLIIFLIGLSLGSFLNVIIFRYNSSGNIIGGRSRCNNCKSVIQWFDLFPIISFLILRGQCRKCLSRISFVYPVVELFTAICLLIYFYNFPIYSFLNIIQAIIVVLLVLILFLDAKYFVIPDKILLSIILAIFLKFLLVPVSLNLYSYIPALVITIIFGILYVVSKGSWIGLGDIKFIFVISLMFDFPASYFVVMSSIWTAAIFSIFLVVFKKAALKTKIPFGSFLALSTIVFILSIDAQKISKYFY